MKRLFFALWPSDQTRKQIQTFNHALKLHNIKLIKADNLHITLIFLGNTNVKSELMLRQKVKDIKVQPFVLHFDQLEFWRKPKVLCLTTQQYDPQLSILVADLKSIVEQCGISIDESLYKPHITLARKARRLINIDVHPMEWQANSFCLLESCSTPEGVHYQVLQRWNFEK